MSQPETHYTTHQVTVEAPADVVFGIVAGIQLWPGFFEPTVHTEYCERGPADERIRLWATANGEVRTWTSRRHLDRAARRIRFAQEKPAPPLLGMGGEWVLEPQGETRTLVELKHDFQVVDDDPAGVAWVNQAVDHNSERELQAVSEIGALHLQLNQLMFSFADEVPIAGKARDVYDFLWAAGEWPSRIPHVDQLSLQEPAPDVQQMEMVTRTGDGSTHTTVSIRLGFPVNRIVYKQTRTPALMRAHTGAWTLSETPSGVLASSEHTVILNPAAVTKVLGPDASVTDAREYVRKALSTNSVTTLYHAKAFVEDGGGRG